MGKRIFNLLLAVAVFLLCSTVVKAEGEYVFVRQWPEEIMGLREPAGVAVDNSGNVYVADRDNHRIQKFDSEGTFKIQWGNYGWDPGQFRGPAGICVDSSGNVYVADTWNDRIQKFDSEGTFKIQWGTEGWDPGQFR
ncbi:hypothetical protein GF312_09250, partial [Candidatus Poribacteria bacterium]|nr:hypothetical protein [Candidatus Poribacteria bacterium]